MAFHRGEKSSLVNKLITLTMLIKMEVWDFLVVLWLGKVLPVQRVRLQFLVPELGPHMPRCQKTKQNGSSVVANSIQSLKTKTKQTVHIKKKNL